MRCVFHEFKQLKYAAYHIISIDGVAQDYRLPDRPRRFRFFQQLYQSNLFTKCEIIKYWFGSIARVLLRQNEARIPAQIWVCTEAQEQKGASFWFLV